MISWQLDATTLSNGKSRRLIVIAWLFVAIVVFLLTFAYYSISVLSAVRSYVGGEGLWSKAQKDMIYALTRYADNHNEAYFQIYRDSLAVTRGDRQARLELDKSDPDLDVARAGLIQGRNHPDDVDGMIRLYRNFRYEPEIDAAIDIWAHADSDIDQLTIIAGRLHASINSGNRDNSVALSDLDHIYRIGQNLMPLEDRFSYTLGQAARRLQSFLLLVMFLVVAVLVVAAFLFSQRLVSQSERVQNTLREAEQQLRRLFKSAPLPIFVVRLADDIILYANDHALAQFKVQAPMLGQIRARTFYVNEDDREHLREVLRFDGSLRDREVQLRDAEGNPFWALISSQCINYHGEDCLLTAISDIDERKRAQQELQRRAFHDDLTGLPNRAMFMDTLRGLFAESAQSGQSAADRAAFALLFVDLDRFKLINDELGHETGDRLLQHVALRLRESVHKEDVVARLGGDEFVVLIRQCPEANAIMQTAQRILNAMKPDHILNGHIVNVTTSIGISRYPQDGTEINMLIKHADIAMYRAKETGRNNAQFYGTAHERDHERKSDAEKSA